MKNLNKILLSAFLILTFTAYALYKNSLGSGEGSDVSVEMAESARSKSSGNKDTNTSAYYKDGEYTGKLTDAFFGDIQVKAVIKDKKLVDVIFLVYPNDRETTIRISNESMPVLRSEAIRLQSAS